MEKVKDKIILSMLNELGLGENAYVGNNPAALVHPLRKLFRGLDVEIEEKSSDGVAFKIGKKVKYQAQYGKIRVTKTAKVTR